MKPIKVNADYEEVLFFQRESPLVNHSLEFLAFFLETRPVFTRKKYTQDFVDYVQELTGREFQVEAEGPFDNWWGPLENISLEKKLNSKELSSELSSDSVVISHGDPLNIEKGKIYLAKSPFGMSGRQFIAFKKGEEDLLKSLLSKTGKLIIEPLLLRRRDFSHYVFPSGEKICYENLVDNKFQYKGTLFTDLASPNLENLRFYHELAENQWKNFKVKLVEIQDVYKSLGASQGYSIDSFIYEEETKLKIRALSEINYRKTMGLLAWLLSKQFAPDQKWSLLLLGKKLSKSTSFQDIRRALRTLDFDKTLKTGVLYLSPGDTRFEVFLLLAGDQEEGERLFKDLRELLPYCEFPVKV